MGRPKKNLEAPGSVKANQLGLHDIVTEINPLWQVILKRFQQIGKIYGFSRVETPVLEDMALYKNFYSQDSEALSSIIPLQQGNKTFGLRPHLLPSVFRTYAEHKVFETQPLSKWLYFGNVVSQGSKGEVFSDYEFGLEVFGGFNHLTEAQVLSAVWQLLMLLGLEQVSLEINTIGEEECQSSYEEVLRDFLKPKKFELCDNCNEHLLGRTLNVFRCENLSCQTIVAEAPTILDFLDEGTHQHFTNILEALDELQIPYQLNPHYSGQSGTSKTNVVIRYKDNEQSFVIGEAAYHEGLMASVAGKKHCCFGFTGSLSKIQTAMNKSGISVDSEHKNEVFLVPLGELAAKRSLRLFRDLTAAHITVYDHFGNAGIKNQLKAAQTFNSPIALIMGQKEAMDEMVILRDVKSGMQEVFSYDKIVEEVKKRLGR